MAGRSFSVARRRAKSVVTGTECPDAGAPRRPSYPPAGLLVVLVTTGGGLTDLAAEVVEVEAVVAAGGDLGRGHVSGLHRSPQRRARDAQLISGLTAAEQATLGHVINVCAVRSTLELDETADT